ncbi:hypothetical protein [Fischerella thermalis]|uniref:hypothetical protein n=1 Tax=Fischerella thermalis TaxID=372787 RepID=UPI0024322B8D|nr:hypothetical protein [Fischerella thermalis]
MPKFPLTDLFDDDMARRAIKDTRIFWIVALLPLLGPLLYICLRPPLQVNLSSLFQVV